MLRGGDENILLKSPTKNVQNLPFYDYNSEFLFITLFRERVLDD